MTDVVQIVNLVAGRHSLDAKLDEDRVVRHTFERLLEVHVVTELATLDECKRNPSLRQAEIDGKILIQGLADPITQGGFVLSWPFATNSSVQYAGGFYDFASADNDFDPSITFGAVNVGIAAHFAIITGAIAGTDIQVQITGTSITDGGVQSGADTEIIDIPSGTPANSYFETSKKWNGQITIETITGTPITCNYGFVKYHDVVNQRFRIFEFEAVWESDSTDSSSDILLLHHRATGWTFNSGAEPTQPTALAQRSVDYAGNNTHRNGPGSWKRAAEIPVDIRGDLGEGILYRVESGNTGVGTVSFRILSLETLVRIVTPIPFP